MRRERMLAVATALGGALTLGTCGGGGPTSPTRCSTPTRFAMTSTGFVITFGSGEVFRAPVSIGSLPCIQEVFVNEDASPHTLTAFAFPGFDVGGCGSLSLGQLAPGEQRRVTMPNTYSECVICADLTDDERGRFPKLYRGDPIRSTGRCVHLNLWCPKWNGQAVEFGGCTCAQQVNVCPP